MTSIADGTDRNSGIGIGWSLVIAAFVLLMYPLSLGPAVCLVEIIGPRTIPHTVIWSLETFYSPLEWVSRHGHPVARDVLNEYVKFWREVAR